MMSTNSTPNGPHQLVASTAGFWWEGWTPDGSSTGSMDVVVTREDVSYVQLTTSKHETFYKDHFYMQEHTNYCAMDPQLGPVVISIKIENILEMERKCFLVIVRTKASTCCEIVPVTVFPDRPTVEQIAKFALSNLQVDRLHPCVGLVQNSLLSYDQHTLTRTFKFGVLPHRAGQTTEEQMFSNLESSPVMVDFLNCIADPIQLQGFSGYRGGLDVKTNMTGESSYYTKFLGREIMFHVSTLLPYSKSDTQQVARKRHIGNDIVCVVFQEDAHNFEPSCVTSNFLKTYIIVQPVPSDCTVEDSVKAKVNGTHYRIAVCSRDDVPHFNPALPKSRVFPRGPEFRRYLLTLLLNAEHASCQSEQFAKLERRTREHLLDQLYKELSARCNQNGSSDQSRHNFVKFVRQKIIRRSTESTDSLETSNVGSFNSSPEVRRSLSLSIPHMRLRSNTVGSSPNATPGSTPITKRHKDKAAQAAEARQKKKSVNVVDGQSSGFNSDDAFDEQVDSSAECVTIQTQKELLQLRDERMKLQRENLTLAKKCASLQKCLVERDAELASSQAESAKLHAELALLKVSHFSAGVDDNLTSLLPNSFRTVQFSSPSPTSVELKQDTQSTSVGAGFSGMV